MQISIDRLSKRYSSEWIFKDLSFEFEPNHCYAIRGSNGSGKSTFLQILTGKLPYTKGKILISDQGSSISNEDRYRYISMAAPYLELIEELSLLEMLKFHFSLNPMLTYTSIEELIDIMGFQKEKNKRVGEFSSGMKQKLKLTIALFTDSLCLILDEPSSNLDQQTKKWFMDLLVANKNERIVIIASNEISDFIEGSKTLNIETYK